MDNVLDKIPNIEESNLHYVRGDLLLYKDWKVKIFVSAVHTPNNGKYKFILMKSKIYLGYSI